MNGSQALLLVALLIGSVLPVANAAATVFQTWVSSTGKDTGTCPVTAPCATFQYAHNQTSVGGTIHAASSGSYGPVSITKSINIIASDGIQAAIAVPNDGKGVTIDNASVSIVVLKGLVITGVSLTDYSYGIYAGDSFAGHLTIDHVTVANTEVGIFAFKGFALIDHCLINGNGSGVLLGLGNPLIYMGLNVISGNTYGVTGAFGSTVQFNSYGDNILNGNTTADLLNATANEVSHDQ
jgi:hypothetical protein